MKWLSIPLKDDIDDELIDQIIDMVKGILPDMDTDEIFIDMDEPIEEEQ